MADQAFETRLIMARHGNTFGPGDIVTRVGGRTDLPLVESGLQQGRDLGLYLIKHNMIPDVILTSTLKRAMQTAEQAQIAMNTHIKPMSLALFNEIDYGPDENKPEDVVVARLGHDAIKAWDEKAIVPDGWRVNPEEMARNWVLFADDMVKKNTGKTILVVTSNGVARFAPYITGDFDGFQKTHGLKMSTGAVSVFRHAAGQWLCDSWNVKPKDHLA